MKVIDFLLNILYYGWNNDLVFLILGDTDPDAQVQITRVEIDYHNKKVFLHHEYNNINGLNCNKLILFLENANIDNYEIFIKWGIYTFNYFEEQNISNNVLYINTFII